MLLTNRIFRIVFQITFVLCLLNGLISCSADSKETGTEEKSNIPLVLSDEYSRMKGGKRNFEIMKNDSLLIDLNNYDFVLPDPAFTYIRENIDYKLLLGGGGGFAYIDVFYNDNAQEIRAEIAKTEKPGVLYLKNVMEKINESNAKKFDMNFRFYIDNGYEEQEIDLFTVTILD